MQYAVAAFVGDVKGERAATQEFPGLAGSGAVLDSEKHSIVNFLLCT